MKGSREKEGRGGESEKDRGERKTAMMERQREMAREYMMPISPLRRGNVWNFALGP